MTDKTNTLSAELLPCPHCGEAPILHEIEAHSHAGGIAGFMPDHPGSWTIECCGGMIESTRAEVVAAWNCRATSAPVAAQAPDTISLQELWDAAGGNPNVKPDKAMLLAAIATQPAPSLQEPVAVPQGWALVPSTPNQAMINAFVAEYCKRGSSESGCYYAMIAAAPVHPIAAAPEAASGEKVGYLLLKTGKEPGTVINCSLDDGLYQLIARPEPRSQAEVFDECRAALALNSTKEA
jgi:hypothetical protein